MNLIVGDSHILCLETYKNKYNNDLHEFSASSIRGLVNETSKSLTREKILDLLQKNKYEKLFIMFGKVDIEWVYPYKCKDGNIDFNNFVNETLYKYTKFISDISKYFTTIYVMGLHHPSLEELDMLKCINAYKAIHNVSSNAMIEVNSTPIKKIGSLKERTAQICFFNENLKEKLKNIDKCKYIDITDELMDKMTNTCKKEFVANMDHHLIRRRTGEVWFEKHLKNLF